MATSSNRLLLALDGLPLAAGRALDAEASESLLIENAGSVVLGELIPGAAHELNNSLFAILGLVELLMADAGPGTRAQDRLELIRASAVEIRDVVRALLRFLPASSERPGAASLDQAVRDAVDVVRRFALAKDVELEERYPDAPLLAPGTASELLQASLGLVLAAVRAPGPERTVSVQVSGESPWVVLAVGGVHIRSGSTSLDLSRAVARRLGGDLVIDGQTGHGAALCLPAVERQ